jgi:hypothetical protein
MQLYNRRFFSLPFGGNEGGVPRVYPKPEPVITVFLVIYQKYTEER